MLIKFAWTMVAMAAISNTPELHSNKHKLAEKIPQINKMFITTAKSRYS
jgi:hypothetical protein